MAPTPDTSPVAGPGPIYPVGNALSGYGAARAELRRPAKQAWAASPDFVGPALLRGRRLEDSTDVYFDGAKPEWELRFPIETGVRLPGPQSGWRYLTSLVLVPGIGCYAFQIDAPDWTIVVVMRGEAN